MFERQLRLKYQWSLSVCLLLLLLSISVWVRPLLPLGVMSKREELISKVAPAPCGSGIRGVELRGGKVRQEEAQRREKRDYFQGKICHIAEEAEERRGERRRRTVEDKCTRNRKIITAEDSSQGTRTKLMSFIHSSLTGQWK